MLTKRYLASVKNVPDIFAQIPRGTAPENYNIEHLKSIGFTSSNDRAIIPLMKDLGFLSPSGVPTERYHAYRGGSPRAVMGQALLDAYQDLFHLNANPTEADREAIKGKFKSAHNVGDRVAEQQTVTFLALLKLADLNAARAGAGLSKKVEDLASGGKGTEGNGKGTPAAGGLALNLGYKIEVYLPATNDIEVYNAIFKSLRENILAK